jgi:hypothetical protein
VRVKWETGRREGGHGVRLKAGRWKRMCEAAAVVVRNKRGTYSPELDESVPLATLAKPSRCASLTSESHSYLIFFVLRLASPDPRGLGGGCGREIPVEPQPTPKAGTAMRVRPVDGVYSPRGVHSGYEVP